MADEHPDIVEELERHYEEWWHSVEPSLQRINLFPVGGEKTPAVELCLFDWVDYEGDANNTVQLTVREGARMFGDWHIEVEETGNYLFEMRRWPCEAETAIVAGLPELQAEDDVISKGVGNEPSGFRHNPVEWRRSVQMGPDRVQLGILTVLFSGTGCHS